MNVATERDEATPASPLATLAISPDLQALLEFDDRLRSSGESDERPRTASADFSRPGKHSPWGKRRQEAATVSLPPPRRKKSVVVGVPMSPKAISELQDVSSATTTTTTSLEVGELGGLEE